MLANKRVLELHQDLRRLPERLVGGEHRRRAPAACGGGNGAGRLGVEGGREQGGLNMLPRGLGVT
jgi:hypothetical protein